MGLLILDRDGVINRDSDSFIKSVDEWVALPGSIEAIAALSRNGYEIHVATNQSGLWRGLFSQSELNAMHEKLRNLVAEQGGQIASIQFCPHGPEEGCECRKPNPGMYSNIAAIAGVDLAGVPVVGDSLRDLQAAAAVGARPVLVKTGKGLRTLEAGGLPPDTLIFDDLADVARYLLHG